MSVISSSSNTTPSLQTLGKLDPRSLLLGIAGPQREATLAISQAVGAGRLSSLQELNRRREAVQAMQNQVAGRLQQAQTPDPLTWLVGSNQVSLDHHLLQFDPEHGFTLFTEDAQGNPQPPGIRVAVPSPSAVDKGTDTGFTLNLYGSDAPPLTGAPPLSLHLRDGTKLTLTTLADPENGRITGHAVHLTQGDQALTVNLVAGHPVMGDHHQGGRQLEALTPDGHRFEESSTGWTLQQGAPPAPGTDLGTAPTHPPEPIQPKRVIVPASVRTFLVENGQADPGERLSAAEWQGVDSNLERLAVQTQRAAEKLQKAVPKTMLQPVNQELTTLVREAERAIQRRESVLADIEQTLLEQKRDQRETQALRAALAELSADLAGYEAEERRRHNERAHHKPFVPKLQAHHLLV